MAKSCTLPFFSLIKLIVDWSVNYGSMGNIRLCFLDMAFVPTIIWSTISLRQLTNIKEISELGYKTAAVFATSAEPSYFANRPEHLPDRAIELISELALKFDNAGDIHAYGEVMEPWSFKFALGAYEEGFGLVHDRLFGLVCDSSNELLEKVLGLYPRHNILAIELISSCNAYGYAVYENGVLIRAMGGCCDEPVSKDIGELLPEEIKYFARSRANAKELVCSEATGGEAEQFDPSEYGEELVFEVAGRFLGKEVAAKPDDTEGPLMQVFKKAIPPRPGVNKTPLGTR